MTHADRVTRQLEDGKSQIKEGAIVHAIYKPTGERGKFRALKMDGKTLKMYRDANRLWCDLDDLVILRVERRGFVE